jgi:uncharacterized protein YjiS (DUF1127 family)
MLKGDAMSCIAPERDRLAVSGQRSSGAVAGRSAAPGWSLRIRPARLFGWLYRPWRRRAAIHELQRCDDRQLRDMGIDRDEIAAVIDELMRRSG